MSEEVVQPHTRRCSSCSACYPILYDGQVQKQGLCTHIAFYKSGMAKLKKGGAKGELDIIATMGKDRMEPAVIDKAFADGYVYVDMCTLRNPHQRHCAHWTSDIINFEEVFSEKLSAKYEPAFHSEFYAKGVKPTADDIYQYVVKKYPFIPDNIKEHVRSGFPTETVTPDLLFRNNYSQHELRRVKDEEKVAAQLSCSNCHFYAPALDENGVMIPKKGYCEFTNLNKGVFAIHESSATPTYSFLSCSKHLLPKDMANVDFKAMTNRMFPFVETNPFNPSLAKMADLVTFPNIDVAPVLTEESLDDLRSRDLFTETKLYRNETDFVKLLRDQKTTAVTTYFARGLKKHTKLKEEEMKPFVAYLESETILFGKVHSTIGWQGGSAGEEEHNPLEDIE